MSEFVEDKGKSRELMSMRHVAWPSGFYTDFTQQSGKQKNTEVLVH